MWVSRLLAHRRSLAIGLGLAALGAVAVGTLSRQSTNESSPAFERQVSFEPIAARAEGPTEVVKLEAALPDPPAQGEAPSPEAPPSPEPASPAETPPQPVATPVAEPAFEQMPVVDPLTNSEVKPVAFSELPAVETPALAAGADSDVPVYVPGSIGKAKRQWAGGDDAGTEKRTGRGFVVTGGGHCPVPGRVIPPYKDKMPWS